MPVKKIKINNQYSNKRYTLKKLLPIILSTIAANKPCNSQQYYILICCSPSYLLGIGTARSIQFLAGQSRTPLKPHSPSSHKTYPAPTT